LNQFDIHFAIAAIESILKKSCNDLRRTAIIFAVYLQTRIFDDILADELPFCLGKQNNVDR